MHTVHLCLLTGMLLLNNMEARSMLTVLNDAWITGESNKSIAADREKNSNHCVAAVVPEVQYDPL